jgi:hypothetical protein
VVRVVIVRVLEEEGRGAEGGHPMWRRRVLLRLRCWFVAVAKVASASKKAAVSAWWVEGMKASVSSAY